MTVQARQNQAAWSAEGGFLTSITSARQLQTFNDVAHYAVNFDVMRSVRPAISLMGKKNERLCLWETRSQSGFVTKPRVSADYITVRFVTNGHIIYRNHTVDAFGTPKTATLVGFEDLNEVQASRGFNAINGTIALDTLARSNADLTGEDHGVPLFETTADVSIPGINALFHTMRQIQNRNQEVSSHDDLISPLLEEIISYQLLSTWPKLTPLNRLADIDLSTSKLKIAIDYINANLSTTLTLAAISAAAGISVRSLQESFRRDIGQTPVQFITGQRLMRAHKDLSSAHNSALSIVDIANRWGFVHMSDFGQRYRRKYGCTPSETRRQAGGR